MKHITKNIAAGILAGLTAFSAMGATYNYTGKALDCGSTGDAIQGLRFVVGQSSIDGSYFLERYNYSEAFGGWHLGYQSATLEVGELLDIIQGEGAALTFTSIALEPTVFGGMVVPATLVAFGAESGDFITGKIADTQSYTSEGGEERYGTAVTDIVCKFEENVSWD